MKQDIENIIKKNLPEKKEECPEYPCQKCNGLGYTAEHDLPSRHGEDGECVSCPIQVQCEECQATGMIGFPDDKNIGFNQALSQIDTSLIADEVLKVIIRKIEEIETFEPEDDFVDGGDMEYASRRLAVDNSRRWGEIKIKTDILQLLSNLSPNKENKK